VRRAARAVLWLVVFGAGLVVAVILCVSARTFLVLWREPLPGDIQTSGSSPPPQLAFACELDTPHLQSLFANPEVISELKQLHAGISLSLIDFSAERAAIVRRLNDSGIAVTAWMALPREQGYYLNSGNEPEAANRFTDFEKWSGENGLRFSRVGLDIEPSLGDFNLAITGHWAHLACTLLGRCFDGRAVMAARSAYAALISRMEHDGYPVETYQFPFLADERKVHATVLERLLGIVDVRGDREALMIYTSFNHSMDSAMIWQYGPDAQVVTVGSTAGDPATSGRFGPLHWDEFSRDLIVASHFSRVVGVYSLEGCVQQGFLPRLTTMDWGRTVTIPAQANRSAIHMRARIQSVLWTLSHLVYLLAAIILTGALILIFRRGKARSRGVGA